MTETQAVPLTSLLTPEAIRLDRTATGREDAIRQTGQALVDTGAVDPSYIDAMLEREQSISTFVGEGVAIPHGTLASKDIVKTDALSVLRFPDGVDWGDGNRVSVTVGIAAQGKGHVKLLQQLAMVLVDPEKAAALRGATEAQQVYDLLAAEEDE